jgi:flagellar biosynthesis protein FliR
MEWDVNAWDWTGLVGQAGASALVLARVLGLCLTAPGLAVPGLAWRFRLGLALVLGGALAPVAAARVVPPTDWPGATWAALAEVLIGAMLGWAAGLIVAGARAAGELVAAQAGLATATLFDPESGEELTPLGRLYGWLATAAFLAMDGPLALVRALLESYATLPAGPPMIPDQALAFAFGRVGRALELALRAAAPPALALVMAGVVLGWLSRTAPALPFLALSLPIRAVLGVVLILLSLTALAVTLAGAWDTLPFISTRQ